MIVNYTPFATPAPPPPGITTTTTAAAAAVSPSPLSPQRSFHLLFLHHFHPFYPVSRPPIANPSFVSSLSRLLLHLILLALLLHLLLLLVLNLILLLPLLPPLLITIFKTLKVKFVK